MNSKNIYPALVLILIVAITVATILVVGSCSGSSDDVDSGRVVGRTSTRVTVLEDDGERDTHKIAARSKKCKINDRWPDCKRKVSF